MPARPVPSATPDETAIREATKKLQSKVDALESELEQTKSRYSSIEKEKDTLNSRLQETNSKLEKAQSALEKSKQAEEKIRGQLAGAQQSLKKTESSGASRHQSRAGIASSRSPN